MSRVVRPIQADTGLSQLIVASALARNPALLEVNLGIARGLVVNQVAIKAAEVWATLEDQQDVVEAVRPCAVDEMTEKLIAAHVGDM